MVAQGMERRAMNMLVPPLIASLSSFARVWYSPLMTKIVAVLLSTILFISLPIASLYTALRRINSSGSGVTGLIKTMYKPFVFSMIAPFSRTCFVRIPMTRVWGGHHIKQEHLLNISNLLKTMSNPLSSFSLVRS